MRRRVIGLVVLVVCLLGAPILPDWFAPRWISKWGPRATGWWFPALLLAYGLCESRSRQCEPYDECGGLGASTMLLLGLGAVLTGFLLGPFAARRTLRYLHGQ